MPTPTNVVSKLIVDKEYRSAAEWMIKLDRPDIFTSWGRTNKERAIERVAGRLASNHKQSLYLRKMGREYPDGAKGAAEEARQQTKDDLPDIFQVKKTENLYEELEVE